MLLSHPRQATLGRMSIYGLYRSLSRVTPDCSRNTSSRASLDGQPVNRSTFTFYGPDVIVRDYCVYLYLSVALYQSPNTLSGNASAFDRGVHKSLPLAA
jgi:hypothetical protein